jgi:hypothetical protein
MSLTYQRPTVAAAATRTFAYIVDDALDECDGFAVYDEDVDEAEREVECFATVEEAEARVAELNAPPEEEEAAATVDTWHGVLMVEGTPTGDGRQFARGAVTWPDLATVTVPLKWQPEESFGHDGSVVVGSTDTIERVGDEIHATGRWHDSPDALAARALVRGGFSRGVSVDVDAAEARFIDEDGQEVDWEDAMWSDDPLIMEITEGRLRASTLCAIPAFIEAQVFDDAEDEALDEASAAVLVASLTASAVSGLPEASWFQRPAAEFADGPIPLTAAGERLFGYLATWGTCHVAFDGVCVTPPESVTNYGYFAKGSTVCADGTTVRTGVITMGTGHASPGLRMQAAAEHYDNTGSIVASVAIGEDETGIWVAGAFHPQATPEQRATLAAAGAISGDWREVGGHLELMAALAVNVPGFPIPVPAVAASGARQVSLVAAGVVRRPETVGMSAQQVGRLIHAVLLRERRVEKAKARMRTHRAATVARKMAGRL